jgi:putative endonuclease
MFYIYILYSESADRYYIGYTNNPDRRLIEHNTAEEDKFTSKFRPWRMLLFFKVSDSRGEAIKVERFIKRQKSRLFLARLLEEANNPEYFKRLLEKVLG